LGAFSLESSYANYDSTILLESKTMRNCLAVFDWQSMVPAIFGLLGVFVGGVITLYGQARERKHRHYQAQFDFYSTLFGIRSEIKAKSMTRLELRQASQKDLGLMRGPARPEDLETYEKSFEYDNKQLLEELVPRYREMLAVWTKNMGLAESSTQEHYQEFVRYVEIWNRGEKKAISSEVILEVQHDETRLYPLYKDLEKQVRRLRLELMH
jgi:hypothetical protein